MAIGEQFFSKAPRLTRVKWTDVQEAMEEVFSIFRSITDDIQRGQTKIVSDGNAPFKVFMPDGDPLDPSPFFEITRNGNTITYFSDGSATDEDGNTVGGGGVDLRRVEGLENAPAIAPFPAVGRIVSGSGVSYQVALFLASTSQPATATVTASVPGADPSGTIPVNSYVLVMGYPASVNAQIIATYEIIGALWL